VGLWSSMLLRALLIVAALPKLFSMLIHVLVIVSMNKWNGSSEPHHV